jgi:type I restriction enzyme S subunit
MVRQQVNAISRQIMQNNINGEELPNLRIPLPPLQMQNEIMCHVEWGARKYRKEQQAPAQIAGEAEREVDRLILGTDKV